MKDSMVFPNEGEWWGHFADGSLKQVLTMKETKWCATDLRCFAHSSDTTHLRANTHTAAIHNHAHKQTHAYRLEQ
jgi:hypothetical protein